ncbi:MAG: cell division protein ZapA [Trichlorobacter sp.]
MTDKQAHLITVLGRNIPVRSTATEERVREIERFVNHELATIQSKVPGADPQLLVTLALLNLSERYLNGQDSISKGLHTEQQLTELLRKLQSIPL